MESERTCWVTVGQCGNQIGRELAKLQLQVSQSNTANVACAPSAVSNRVAVDSEAKVLLRGTGATTTTGTSAAKHPSRTTASNVIHEHSGRGSNWALGYTSGMYGGWSSSTCASFSSATTAPPSTSAVPIRNNFKQLSTGSVNLVDADSGADRGVVADRQRGIMRNKIMNSSSAHPQHTSRRRGASSPTPTGTNLGLLDDSNQVIGECAATKNEQHQSATDLTESLLFQEPYLVHGVKAKVRQVLEKSDKRIENLVLLHSVAGGTGSGLGSRLLEEFAAGVDHGSVFSQAADEQDLNLVSCAVLPIWSQHSETCLQAYNACFSAAWMQDFCNGNLLFENEFQLEKILQQQGHQLSSQFGGKTMTNHSSTSCSTSTSGAYTLVNQQFAETINSLNFTDFLTYVTPMPSHHFAHAFSYRLDPLIAKTNAELEHRNFLKKRVLPPPLEVARKHLLLQVHATVFNESVTLLQPEWFSTTCDPVPWNRSFVLEQKRSGGPGSAAGTAPTRSTTRSTTNANANSTTPAATRGQAKQLSSTTASTYPDVTLALNWSRTGDLFRHFLDRAKKMYRGRAFFHAFEQYGFGHCEFENMFETVEELVANYSPERLLYRHRKAARAFFTPGARPGFSTGSSGQLELFSVVCCFS
ncbi:unnamed protein product [Amoebophrya sp. A120]|nr:unnamed protein product [Amoebophrya sp. A120]|eukprot:GSA120T00007801001.1